MLPRQEARLIAGSTVTSLAGRTLSHYTIHDEISRGGMGIVYRAVDTKLNREVAFKVLPPELVANADRRRRFVQEAQAAAALEHPHIAVIYEVDEAEDVTFIAMELIRGEKLSDILERERLSVARALDLGIEVAEGLGRAHEKSVIHRDLKPANVMLTQDGHAKIIDFGLAKLVEPLAGADTEAETALRNRTDPGLIVGTASYMSPEQARGSKLDHRSDIFALGVTLHEMLAGALPFKGKSRVETLSAILNAPAPPLDLSAAGEASVELSRIVAKCLAKDPEDRYQGMRDLVVDLRAARRKLEFSSTPAALPMLAAARPASRRKLLALAAAGLFLFAAGLAWTFAGRSKTGAAGARRVESLAVLPLDNLSRDPEQEYFADGMTEAIIADLGKIRALRVISRTSAMRYRGTKKSLPEIARELNVDAVVEGSVLKSGERVRITAQLIHAATDQHLWSESYEGDLKDVLALQAQVARAIASEIKVAVTPQEQARLAHRRSVDPAAHQLYLKGRYFWNKRTAESLKAALALFEQAIQKDPSDPAARAGLADTYGLMGFWSYGVLPPREAMPKAKAAALEALQLDESLAEAHSSLGWVSFAYDWEFPKAEKHFRRAIELNPGYATAHYWYSTYLSSMGRHPEALAEAMKAVELDPLSLIINAVAGAQRYWAGRPELAIEQFRKVLEMDRGFPIARQFLGYSYIKLGRHREGVSELQSVAAEFPDTTLYTALLAEAHALAGQRPEALRVLEGLKAVAKKRHVPSEQLALAYAGLGEKDEAFAWLDKAYEERSSLIVYLKVDPVFDPLRSDRRLAELAKRIGLPE